MVDGCGCGRFERLPLIGDVSVSVGELYRAKWSPGLDYSSEIFPTIYALTT